MTLEECINIILKTLEEKKIVNQEKKTKEILEYITNQSVSNLEKNKKVILNNATLKRLDEVIKKINKNMPIAYIIGKHEFMGVSLTVNRHVFISSPETEILVKEVIKIIKTNEKLSQVLELCTGSGAIAIAIAKNVNNVQILATDISRKALGVANQNLSLLENYNNVKFIQSNLFENIKRKVNVIVANPPYGKSEEIRKKDNDPWKLYEPLLARDGGTNGLKFIKQIIWQSHSYLHSGGYLCLEIGHNQKEAVVKLLEEVSVYKNIYFKKAKDGDERILICQK